MVQGIVIGLAALASMTPASGAQAAPYLGYGEAVREIGAHLHRNYYVERGSLETDCQRLARNRVRCWIEFGYQDGDWGCGYATVRETRRSYYVSSRTGGCSL